MLLSGRFGFPHALVRCCQCQSAPEATNPGLKPRWVTIVLILWKVIQPTFCRATCAVSRGTSGFMDERNFPSAFSHALFKRMNGMLGKTRAAVNPLLGMELQILRPAILHTQDGA